MLRRPASWAVLVVSAFLSPAIGCGAEVEDKAKAVLGDWYKGIAEAKTLSGETSAAFQVLQAGTEVQAQRDGYTFALKRPQHFIMKAKDAAGLTLVNDDKQLYQALGSGKVYTEDKPFASIGDIFSKSVILSQTNLQQGLSLLGDALAAESFEKLLAGLGDVKYVGEEMRDGEKAHHLLIVFQKTPHDAWFTAEAKPKLMRLLPDLKTIAAANGRELPPGVDLKLTVDFMKWAYDEEPAADAFAAVPPKDFELVPDLFAPPAVRMVGKAAPSFELPTLAGSPFKLSEQVGKVVVLDFWATWCGPCVAALPKINETTAKYKEKGVVFQAVNQQEEASIVKEVPGSAEARRAGDPRRRREGRNAVQGRRDPPNRDHRQVRQDSGRARRCGARYRRAPGERARRHPGGQRPFGGQKLEARVGSRAALG